MAKRLNINNDEVYIEHLQMIEDVITRLSNNSKNMKGWFLAVISVLFGFLIPRACISLLLITVTISIAFWVLDSYYLALERRYRRLYAAVIKRDKEIPQFSMEIDRYNSGREHIISALFSLSTIGFYLPLIISLSLITRFDLGSRETPSSPYDCDCSICKETSVNNVCHRCCYK